MTHYVLVDESRDLYATIPQNGEGSKALLLFNCEYDCWHFKELDLGQRLGTAYQPKRMTIRELKEVAKRKSGVEKYFVVFHRETRKYLRFDPD